MGRVHWTPNGFGFLLVVWGSLWLGGQYLKLLRLVHFVPDVLKIFILGALFIATPFLIWRAVELVAELYYNCQKWILRK